MKVLRNHLRFFIDCCKFSANVDKLHCNPCDFYAGFNESVPMDNMVNCFNPLAAFLREGPPFITGIRNRISKFVKIFEIISISNRCRNGGLSWIFTLLFVHTFWIKGFTFGMESSDSLQYPSGLFLQNYIISKGCLRLYRVFPLHREGEILRRTEEGN